MGADQRAKIAIPRFQAEQVVADAVRDDTELLGGLLKLRTMEAQQLQLALKNAGGIDDEGGLFEFIQEIEQESVRLVGRIRIVKFRHRAVELGVPDDQSRRRVIRMAIFPIGSKHEFRTMTPDGARYQLSVFRRIDKSAIRQIQRFASMRAEEFRRSDGLDLAMFLRPTRSHFAVGEIHDSEGSPGILQKKSDATGAPFHIVRVRAKEENVDWHKQP